ncbi:MAG: hypothetical protein EOP83_05855 [Verrucomicrobiaceae bacterium]|nr:MAG: hypothetical protein EOP83_05855 [Verrucomicrobiaceae bacterium]
MKAFVFSHEGIVVGAWSVVIAEDRETAQRLFEEGVVEEALKKKNYGIGNEIYEVKEIDLSRPGYKLIDNGDT